jgi:type IV secretion system protein VirB2
MAKKHIAFLLLVFVVCLGIVPDAFAGAGQGGNLPYEGWLESVRASATGPVAYAFGLIGIVVCGGVLIFGGDLNGFFRSMLVVVLVMALLVTANTIMVDLFGTSAEIAGVSRPAPCLDGAA